MKNIFECFSETQNIVSFIKSSCASYVDEGLKDMLNDTIKKVKDKLGNLVERVITYAKGVVAKISNYYMATDEDGNLQACSTPLTMGAAYKNGLIDKNSTFIGMGKEAGRLVGASEPFANALKMYPSTKDYWKQLASQHKTNESLDEEKFIASLCESNKLNCGEFDDMLNEVKMANEDPQAKYNVIVDDKKLRDIIKRHINNPRLARLMIWGAPGIGKTAILTTIVNEISAEQGKDYSLIVKTLSNETPDNFMLPKYSGDRAEDVPKTWMPVWKPTGDEKVDKTNDEKCGRGLLFIDELSRATPQVQNVILPLVNEGVFNGWKLGSGWAIICASNRDEDEDASNQTQIGNALGNRFAQVYYEPCVNTWKGWADKQGFISPLLTQWLAMPAGETISGGKFFYWDPNDDDDTNTTHIMCTPRSWTNAMRDLAEYHHTGTLEGFNIFDIDEFDLKFVLNKYVPAQAVDQFWAFLQTISHIGDFDNAVRSAWSGHGAGLKINKKDLVKVAMPLAQLIVCAHKNSLPTAAEFESLADFLVKMGSEQLTSYTLDVFKNVFGANIPDQDSVSKLNDCKSYMFTLARLYKKDPDFWKSIHIFDAFLSAWNIDYDTMPDYMNGLKAIATKYREAFASAVVDGAEGLG